MRRIDASPQIIAVTPDDNVVYDPPLVGIRVGTTAGDIKVRSGGADVVITGVQVGEQIPASINKVYNTGTSAAGLNGWQWENT